MNRLLYSLVYCVVGLLAAARISAFSTTTPLSRRSGLTAPPSSLSSFSLTRQSASLLLWAKNKSKKKSNDDDDEEEEEEVALGMDAAFEKLDGLTNLGGGDDDDVSSKRPAKPDTAAASSSSSPSSSSSSLLPLEQEIEVYKNLVGESESKQDVYTDVLADMVVTTKDDSTDAAAAASLSTSSSLLDDPAMQQALQDAMKEASAKNPSSAAALNDKEIMEEIEAIMERGNEELLASLEEIRKEQSAYAASKANDKAQKAADEYEAAQRARLDAAENAVQIWLQRVKKEQAAVQQAVEDLAAAQAEMGGKTDGLSKLRAGGLPKQMALVGAVLFSVRSIIDTIGSLTDPSLQSAALIQGAIAVACAIYLFFL